MQLACTHVWQWAGHAHCVHGPHSVAGHPPVLLTMGVSCHEQGAEGPCAQCGHTSLCPCLAAPHPVCSVVSPAPPLLAEEPTCHHILHQRCSPNQLPTLVTLLPCLWLLRPLLTYTPLLTARPGARENTKRPSHPNQTCAQTSTWMAWVCGACTGPCWRAPCRRGGRGAYGTPCWWTVGVLASTANQSPTQRGTTCWGADKDTTLNQCWRPFGQLDGAHLHPECIHPYPYTTHQAL